MRRYALIPAALLLTGCGTPAESTPAEPVTVTTTSPTVTAEPTPDQRVVEADQNLQDALGAAPMDMSGIHPDVLESFVLEPVEYVPDGAMMCPTTGGACVQAEVLGQALEADIMRSLEEAEAELDAM